MIMNIGMNIGFEKTSYLRCFKVWLGEMLSKGDARIRLCWTRSMSKRISTATRST